MKSGPFIHSGHTTQRLMVITTLAMLPMMAASIWINGFDAVILLAASILSVLAMEVVCKWRIILSTTLLL